MTSLLYLSCHSTLEYDELKIFNELGLKVFSVGSYLDPSSPLESLRPSLQLSTDPSWLEQFKKICPDYEFNGRAKLTKEFVDQFDLIMISHFTHYIQDNWEILKDKNLIYSPVGQSTAWLESQLTQVRERADLKIVRVSSAEEVLVGYAGHDAIIRPIVDSNEFTGWTGEENCVVTVNKWMKKRSGPCFFDVYESVTEGLPRKLYGQENEDISYSNGELSYEDLKTAYRVNRVAYCSTTSPAPFVYTLAESFMTGCPVVTLGPKLVNARAPRPTYEAYKFIENGVDGFWANDIGDLRYYIRELLNDYDLAKKISKAGRAKAMTLFDKSICVEAWRDFLNSSYGLSL